MSRKSNQPVLDTSQDPGLTYSQPIDVVRGITNINPADDIGVIPKQVISPRVYPSATSNAVVQNVTEVKNIYVRNTNYPGGNTNEVQISRNGSFVGDAEFKYNPNTNSLELLGAATITDIYATNYYFSNGTSILSKFNGLASNTYVTSQVEQVASSVFLQLAMKPSYSDFSNVAFSGDFAELANVPESLGSAGSSAYEIAVTNGFSGTEIQWLDSLVGAKGDQGDPGQRGATGAQGVSVTLVGSVDDSTVLPEEGSAGQGYITLDTGNLWFWNTISSSWNDIGQIVGPQGDVGDKGDKGDVGDAGAGIAAGGATGQVLAKVSSDDYDTTWTTPFSGEYSDLANTPSIPFYLTDLDNNAGFVTIYELDGKLIINDDSELTPGDSFVLKTEDTVSIGQYAMQNITAGPGGIQIAGTGGVTIMGAATAEVNLGGQTSGNINFNSPTTGISYTHLSDTPTIPTDINQLTDASELLSGGSSASTGNITFSDTTMSSTNGNVKISFSPTASPAVEFNFTTSGEFIAGEVQTRLVRGTSQAMSLINIDGVGMRIDSYNQPTSIDIGDTTTWDFVRLRYGAGSVTGNDGDVEIRSIPMGSPSAPSSISISPQGGENGSFTFGGDGTLTVPYGKLGLAPGEVFGIVADESTAVTIQSDAGAQTWSFDTNGILTLPVGGDIVRDGTSVLGAGGGADTGSITFTNSNMTSPGDVTITFEQVSSPAVVFSFTTTGEFITPQVVTSGVTTNQVDMYYTRQVSANTNVTCPPNVDTIIHTGTDQWQHTFKLLLKVEGNEDSAQQGWDTQSCEMMIAKSYRNNTMAGSVYGLVYTSTNPLATFSTRWNASINRVEVLCRPTSTTENVVVRSFVTEMTSSD